MLSVGGGGGGRLPDLVVPGHYHRRSKSDCGLNQRKEDEDEAPYSLASLTPHGGGRHQHHHHHHHAHTRPTTPVMVRTPSTSSIPEIFISGEEEGGPGVSPVTRLAVFSLADFLETVANNHHSHHHSRKKCSSSEVGGSGHGGGRRRSPLAARKSTPVGGGGATPGGGGGEVNANANCNSTVAPGGGGGGALGQSRASGGSGRQSSTTSYYEDAAAHSSNEDCDVETVPSSGVSNGSGELVETLRVSGDTGAVDDGEELTPHVQRTREVLEHLQAKIQKTKDLIKEEQKARDENVNEYLKLAANADRQQMARIKAVFEKKNQKSAALILQLQKKLENYHKRLREIETHGLTVAHRQPKEMLRDMGQGLKTVINKPKEIAHLIKNKFGSADNIKELAGEEERDEERVHHGSATLPVGASLVPPTSTNQGSSLPSSHHQTSSAQGAGGSSSGGGHHGSKIGSEEGSECNSSITSESVPGGSTTLGHLASPRNHHSQLTGVDFYGSPGGTTMDQLLMELRESREETARLREDIDTIKQALAAEVNSMREGLAEERFRCDRLEEQVNDLTELHQNEMGNLVTNMADMEEKVQYQSEERIRDLHEIVESCHTRISRMEHQQAQQQQQYLTLEGLENSNARAVFVKLINVLLTVLQVLLLVVATVANILTPLLQTRTRLVVTALLVFLLVFVYIQFPELRETWLGIVARYKQFVNFK